MKYAAITERLAHTGGAKWAIHQRSREMKAKGADIIELTIGEPDLPPDPKLFEICHQSMLAGRTGYSSGRGEPELLEAIAARYARRRAGVDTNNVLCFPGTQTALFATMMGLTGPGDGVLVGDPFYATYEGVITASGAHRQSVPLKAENGFRLTASDLEAAITPQSRVLLLNSPHNPTGAVLSSEEVAEISAVCKAHDLWIVADEVYEELVFDGEFASPFDIPELAGRVIAVSSISKSHAAPGFRSGWAVGPHDFCEKLLPLSETMLFGNQPFIADMTAFALNSDLTTSTRMRASYKRRSAMFADTLETLGSIVPFRPQAGMFIVFDVSGTGLDGETFAWRLLEAGVAVMPGSSFGENAGKLIRLSLTVPDESVVEACSRISNFVEHI
ncbi:pyridoxal phosphate-dependent aminotransferase [Hoeflea sp.]|uniref:pyridoxal phosphate-dependent aminotransferase n=1 Tax=Hoeflea sp. TaxID=1940281 RepID=UPI003A90F345